MQFLLYTYISLCQLESIEKLKKFLANEYEHLHLSTLYNRESYFNECVDVVQNKCPCKVNAVLCEYPCAYNENKSKRITLHQELQKICDLFQSRNLTDEELKYCLKIISKRTLIIHQKHEELGDLFFEGRQKGTKRYNLYYSTKLIKTIEGYSNAKYQTFGLTLTYDTKTENGNRLFAWQNFYKQMHDLFHYLRKAYKCKIVWVLESTKKQFPHAHVMLAFKPGTFGFYDKMRARTSIKYGPLFKIVKKYSKNPVFHLEKVSGNKLKFYFSKYITKSSTTNIFNLQDKKGLFEDDERKMIVGIVATILANVRQFALPHNRINKKKLDEVQNAQAANGSNAKSMKDENTSANPQSERRGKIARKRADLMNLCTNCTKMHDTNVRFMPLYKYNRLFKVPFEEFAGNSSDEIEFFDNESKPLSCGGCFWSHLVIFVLTGKDEYMNPFIENENGEMVRLFQPEDFENDEVYMTKFLWWTEYALSLLETGQGLLREVCCSAKKRTSLIPTLKYYYEMELTGERLR